MRFRLSVLALCILSAPASALAGDYGVSVGAGYFDMTQSSNSAKAVFGSTGGLTFGGDVRAGIGSKGIYVSLGVRYFSKDGNKVFISGPSGTVFPFLNEPLKVHLIPVEATLGYRFKASRAVIPYLGAGVGITSFHEEDTAGGVTTTNDRTKFSAHATGGIEFGSGNLRLALELNFSTVPSAIGVGGVSAIYNEKDIGGFTVLGKVSFASSKR